MLTQVQKHPSLRYSQEIAAICLPLQKLNISYFAHVHITHEKKLSAISTHPLFTEHYLKNKFYTADIHMVDESKFGNFFVWDGIEFSGESGRMCREAGEFGVHNPFTIIERHANGIDYFHFASHMKGKQINQAYLANLDLLHLFIAYFKDNIKQSKLLSQAYKLTFDIYSVPPISFEDNSIIYDRSEFVRDIHLKHDPDKIQIDNVTLSKRQSEILRLVVHGKTIKEISRLLNLSERTVGHYFDTVKMKLNVSSRPELISKVMQFEPKKFFQNCK